MLLHRYLDSLKYMIRVLFFWQKLIAVCKILCRRGNTNNLWIYKLKCYSFWAAFGRCKIKFFVQQMFRKSLFNPCLQGKATIPWLEAQYSRISIPPLDFFGLDLFIPLYFFSRTYRFYAFIPNVATLLAVQRNMYVKNISLIMIC
jgi:hypothetical protein